MEQITEIVNKHVLITPMLYNLSMLVIYRENGEEVPVKINKQFKTLSANIKLSPEEANYIIDNYLK